MNFASCKKTLSFGTFINPMLCRLAHQHFTVYHLIQCMEQFLPLCFFFMIFELRFWHKIYEQRITKRILKKYVCSSKSKPMSIIRKFIFQTDEEDTCGSLTLDSDVRFCVWRAFTRIGLIFKSSDIWTREPTKHGKKSFSFLFIMVFLYYLYDHFSQTFF